MLYLLDMHIVHRSDLEDHHQHRAISKVRYRLKKLTVSSFEELNYCCD